jgi:hypothetical protein
MKKRGCPSPDHGDGFALTFAVPVLPDLSDEERFTQQHARTNFDPFRHMGGRR